MMTYVIGFFLLAIFLVLVAIVFRIAAAILRGSVALTNSVFGGRELEEIDYRRAVYDGQLLPRPKTLSGLRIPMPNVLYAVVINIISGVVSSGAFWAVFFGATFLLVASYPEPTAPENVNLITTQVVLAVGAGGLASLLASVVVLKMALPTTFVKAVVVTFFQFVLSFVVGAILAVGLVILMGIQPGDIPGTKPPSSGWVR